MVLLKTQILTDIIKHMYLITKLHVCGYIKLNFSSL